MSEHPYYYSMVVDSRPLHSYEADNLLFTLEKYGEVRANLSRDARGFGSGEGVKLVWSYLAKAELAEIRRYSIGIWGRAVAIRYMREFRVRPCVI